MKSVRNDPPTPPTYLAATETSVNASPPAPPAHLAAADRVVLQQARGAEAGDHQPRALAVPDVVRGHVGGGPSLQRHARPLGLPNFVAPEETVGADTIEESARTPPRDLVVQHRRGAPPPSLGIKAQERMRKGAPDQDGCT